MRPSCTPSTTPASPRAARSPRLRGFVRWALAAGVLVTAPTSASARGLDERTVDGGAAEAEAEARELSRRGEFVAASRAWSALATSSEDPQTRAVAAFRGYQASVSAYEVEGDSASLCVARGLVSGLAADAAVDLPIREDASRRLAEIEALLSDPELAGICDAEADTDAETRPTGATLPAGPALLPSRSPSAEPPGRGTRAASAGGEVDDVRDSSSSSEKVRRLRVAGVFSVTAGAALFGAMTYGLVVDARAAADLREYLTQAEQGLLSAADWWRIEGLREEGRSASQLATATGIAGGVALVSGVALIVAGRRLDRRESGVLTSTPRLGLGVGKGHASLTLRGRF